MSSSRTKNSIRNVFSGMILKLVGILMPFVIRTIMIKKLGMDYLGLNSLFSSILQVLSLSELGFSTAVAFCLYKPIECKENDVVCSLLNYLKKAYYVIGTIILVIGLLLTPFLPNLINGTCPDDVNLYILYFIYLFNTVISYFFFAYRGILLNASQRSDVENKVITLVNMTMYICQIIVLLLFSNYYVYIIFLPLSTIFINLIKLICCKKMFPEFSPRGKINDTEKKIVNDNIKALIGHRLSSIVVNSTDSIFISAFLGLTVLGIFQNYFYIVSSLLAVVTIIYSSITPSIGNSITFESKEKNLFLFNNLTFLNVLMIGWMSICMLTLYQHFMYIWVGPDNMLPFTTVIFLVLYFYTWKFKEILSVFKDSAGMWTIDFWKPYAITILNLIFDFILIKIIGINGVLIATICSVSVLSLPWETQVFYKRYFGIKPTKYYLKLAALTLLVIIAGSCTYFTCYFLPTEGIIWFIVKMIICCILPNIIFIIFTHKSSEFKFIISKVKYGINIIMRKR